MLTGAGGGGGGIVGQQSSVYRSTYITIREISEFLLFIKFIQNNNFHVYLLTSATVSNHLPSSYSNALALIKKLEPPIPTNFTF